MSITPFLLTPCIKCGGLNYGYAPYCSDCRLKQTSYHFTSRPAGETLTGDDGWFFSDTRNVIDGEKEIYHAEEQICHLNEKYMEFAKPFCK